MLNETQRSGLISLSQKIKQSFDNFHHQIIGELRVGGVSGYLCRYETCALETEEDGLNADGHSKKLLVELQIASLKMAIDKLGTGKNEIYGGDEDHHWVFFIGNFLNHRAEILKFFQSEQEALWQIRATDSVMENFKKVVLPYQDFEDKVAKSVLSACDIIAIANCVSYSTHNGIKPSPELCASYKLQIREIITPKSPRPESIIGLQCLLDDKSIY